MGIAQPNNEGERLDATDLLDSDKAILDVLREGRATKGYIVDNADISRNTAYNRLEVLEAAEHVREVHEPTRLFELVDDPRQESTGGPDVQAAQSAVDDLELALERGERGLVGEAVDRLKEALDVE